MAIKNLVKIPASGKVDNQFVGIKISNNQIEFHYPETKKTTFSCFENGFISKN